MSDRLCEAFFARFFGESSVKKRGIIVSLILRLQNRSCAARLIFISFYLGKCFFRAPSGQRVQKKLHTVHHLSFLQKKIGECF